MKEKRVVNELSFTWLGHKLGLNRTGASIYSVLPTSETSVIGAVFSVILCSFMVAAFPILIGAFNIACMLRNKLTSN